MHTDKNEEKQAAGWFFGAGIAALSLVAFLVWADNYLTHGGYPAAIERHDAELEELRTAQFSVGVPSTDPRLRP